MSRFTLVGSENYSATVVALKELRPIPKADKIQQAIIFGNSVIVGADAKIGDIGLFFPVEVAISPAFLGANNLYRKPEYGNANLGLPGGFFEQHGRVRAMKMRGVISEGFFAPIGLLGNVDGVTSLPEIGCSFDAVDGVEMCRKYVPYRQARTGAARPGQPRQSRPEDMILPNQFRFHFDTKNLRRNVDSITPHDTVSITEKFHGTSVVIANLPVARKMSLVDRLARFFGASVAQSEFGLIWSSRRVVKSAGSWTVRSKDHHYKEDVWATVAKRIQSAIPPGYSVYGEIVGYTPSGTAIQSMGGHPFSYGCEPGKCALYVYRVTSTAADGTVLELSWPQVRRFCADRGLTTVPDVHYGPASAITPDHEVTDDEWRNDFMSILELFVQDKMCARNSNMVPLEALVVRVEDPAGIRTYKLKNFLFLSGESKQADEGVVDIESEEGVA